VGQDNASCGGYTRQITGCRVGAPEMTNAYIKQQQCIGQLASVRMILGSTSSQNKELHMSARSPAHKSVYKF